MAARMFLSVGDPLTDAELFAFTFGPEEDGINGNGGDNSLGGTPFPDTMFGFAGKDTIFGNDGEPGDNGIYLDDRINGGTGNDLLGGEEGNDLVHGRAANDEIFGGPGNDALFGDGGNDELLGGIGLDLLVGGDYSTTRCQAERTRTISMAVWPRCSLTGGTGPDIFHFVATAESGVGAAVRDRITDFGATDTIDLSTIDAKPAGGNQEFDFIGGAAFNAPGQMGDGLRWRPHHLRQHRRRYPGRVSDPDRR